MKRNIKIISVSLPAGLVEVVQRQAYYNDISVSQFVKQALVKLLQEENENGRQEKGTADACD